jgi:hypothetical protein
MPPNLGGSRSDCRVHVDATTPLSCGPLVRAHAEEHLAKRESDWCALADESVLQRVDISLRLFSYQQLLAISLQGRDYKMEWNCRTDVRSIVTAAL